MNTKTVEEEYNDFWKDIVENPDGSLNVEQVKKELSDYSFLLHGIPLIYGEVTGGMEGEPNTMPEAVIRRFNDHVTKLLDEAIEEERELVAEEMGEREEMGESESE